ncbi:MAG TPA: hypothetical protein VGP36_26155 [Mycobacteriales bacterium]|nr:hypothetical protein [Mycobacteriales bacterium]
MTSATDASVVPIRLTLDGRTGVTLWATPWEEDGEEWQAFLGAGQHVLVFGTVEEMAEHLRSGEENDLTDHPRWKDLLQLAPGELEPDEDYVFDLDGAYELALADPDPYTVSELSDLVDLVQRVAEVCDDGVLLRLVEETPEFAALLADDASFAGAEGEDRWTRVGGVVERSWEPLLERFAGLVEWRGSEVLAEDAQTAADRDDDTDDDEDIDVVDLTDDSPAETADEPRTGLAAELVRDAVGSTGAVEVEGEDPTDDGEYSIWEVAGILPLSVTLPSGTGYTLRTYNGPDDEPVFLGADLTVDMFRTADGLVAYCRSGAEHDLSEMVTWADIAEVEEDLPVEPEPEEVYDLRSPSEDAVELALEIADYCDLDGVTATLTRRRTGEIPFDAWTAAIDELGTCIRWHD